ncbi:MAG: alpha/beta hydrolase [Phycisphaerales bacterium]|jgi:alpha-beta hydrolase superfamily lysophospholipase
MPTTSHTIECPSGYALAAKLDEPEGEVVGFAVFAHCFTCSKDSIATSRVSRALAARGIGVLRVDFTGLGRSEGEFGDSTFTGNVQDLRASCAWLSENRMPPGLLIGHSLGGAAVLALAGGGGDEISSVRGVVTIGAPADPEHVTHLFDAGLEEIRRAGSAEVSIGGRPFRVGAGLVEDLQQQDPQRMIANLRRALMIFHSPVDAIVGIENAAKIYGWAKHPRSFVSLDKADHLLTNKDDAELVAGMLAAWARHLLGG